MLKQHLQSINDIFVAIQEIKELASGLPDGMPKYRLLAQVELMEREADDYADNTTDLYDQMLVFAMRCAV